MHWLKYYRVAVCLHTFVEFIHFHIVSFMSTYIFVDLTGEPEQALEVYQQMLVLESFKKKSTSLLPPTSSLLKSKSSSEDDDGVDDDLSVAAVRNNLASVLMTLHRFEDAAENLLKVKSVYEKKRGADDVELANVLSSYASCLYCMKQEYDFLFDENGVLSSTLKFSSSPVFYISEIYTFQQYHSLIIMILTFMVWFMFYSVVSLSVCHKLAPSGNVRVSSKRPNLASDIWVWSRPSTTWLPS
jgi:hypothetical protein